MDRYFLGAFGNGKYVRPQFEILKDNSLSMVDDIRRDIFPNGGTITLYHFNDNDINGIKNRLFKFRIDLNRDISPVYDIYSDNSNKFQIEPENIVDCGHEEIIEIIDTEYSVEEVLNDKNKRKFKLDHKPNQLILFKHDQKCFGPFECISAFEDPYYNVNVFINSNVVNIYNYSELLPIVYDAYFSIRRSDQMSFIYNLSKLNEHEPQQQIEYFDNEELAEYLQSLLRNSETIENVSNIRNDFLKIANGFSEEGVIDDKKIEHLSRILQTAEDLSDCKVKITDEYFKHNPNAARDKEKYLQDHEELLYDLARSDTRFDDVKQELSEQLSGLENEREQVNALLLESRQKLDDQQAELEKLKDQAVSEKKQELDELILSKKNELENLNREIEKAEQEKKDAINSRDVFKKEVDNLTNERFSIMSDINNRIVEWAAENRSSSMIKLLVSQLEMPEADQKAIQPEEYIIAEELQPEEIASILCSKLKDAGRAVTLDDAYNYLISVVQNYITVFAGEPGTGKTSVCKLIAKALGLYDKRFSCVQVERGWTSSRDLVGYYNPLTKAIEKTQPEFSACMERLDFENRNDSVRAPYFVLLDEANLSPIEFYWSTFNYYCDAPKNQKVEFANGKKYEFGEELKFLATINYDQTTTNLSPRFLDRAWVISMNPVAVDSINLIDDEEIENNKTVVSLKNLQSAFGREAFSDKKLNQVTNGRINELIRKMNEGGHRISPRSRKAVICYYLAAEEYMSSKEAALDFAVSQKILPCINGNSREYGEFLNSLLGMCGDFQLSRSAEIISRIIAGSEHDFYGFFSI